MSEPKRWLQDDSAPREVVDLLRAAHRPRSASTAKRMALVGVLAKVATEPPRTTSWLGWMKAALYGLGVVVAVLAISAARGQAPARSAAASHGQARSARASVASRDAAVDDASARRDSAAPR